MEEFAGETQPCTECTSVWKALAERTQADNRRLSSENETLRTERDRLKGLLFGDLEE